MVQCYSIEFKRLPCENDIVAQFFRLKRTAKYQHDTHYPSTAIFIGLSHNDGFMCRKEKIKTGKKGRPKEIFVRDEANPFYNTSISHEADTHIHFISVGKGSRALTEKLIHNENKRAKKSIAKLYRNNHIPIDYARGQSCKYCEIGNLDEYN